MTRGKRLLICGVSGLLIGAGIAALIGLGVIQSAIKPTDLCFYIGVGGLILAVISMMRGNSTAALTNGNGLADNMNGTVAVEEDKITQSRGKNFLTNHVMELNLFGVFMLPLGLELIIAAMFFMK